MKILVGGDYVPRENIARLMEAGDFSYFDEIKQLTNESDYTIVNLEAPIVSSDAKPIEKCGPNLRTSSRVVDSLRYAGIDMVTMANNHIMDYGEQGLRDSLKALTASNMEYCGVGKNLESAKEVKYLKIKGKALAVVNCCEHEFSIATSHFAGANPLNPISQYNSIQEAKKRADFVLVIIHGGHELWQLPSPRMVETYRFFVDAGADAVVNHHQHCFSGYEVYKGKPIFYGLGNLCFEYASRKNAIWNYGYLVMLEFNNNNDVTFQVYPYSQCNGDSEIKMLAQDAFKVKINELNNIIKDPELLKKTTYEYYSKCDKQMREAFEPYSGRVLSKLYHMGILPTFLRGSKFQKLKNYINCESHRDKVSFNLQNLK